MAMNFQYLVTYPSMQTPGQGINSAPDSGGCEQRKRLNLDERGSRMYISGDPRQLSREIWGRTVHMMIAIPELPDLKFSKCGGYVLGSEFRQGFSDSEPLEAERKGQMKNGTSIWSEFLLICSCMEKGSDQLTRYIAVESMIVDRGQFMVLRIRNQLARTSRIPGFAITH
ncbi:hypothetical protein PAAG_12085 [Paracoccidioides lutzii Pb01]|uniref:Uncharacterized protein n=1 Tax=Paracoccidioides lutzii (strain ATCC MYA-826 / Pb01) TaxID=502779 RepID=A0A0A2V4G0_PARBA|nr:hypothetical protein PAAG_12085 [Paracoccidioides lutzii Pb01]KGQ01227.1 hypothetical protein PAAG_12085 [Paracoccidioides lutzii Pb01]